MKFFSKYTLIILSLPMVLVGLPNTSMANDYAHNESPVVSVGFKNSHSGFRGSKRAFSGRKSFNRGFGRRGFKSRSFRNRSFNRGFGFNRGSRSFHRGFGFNKGFTRNFGKSYYNAPKYYGPYKKGYKGLTRSYGSKSELSKYYEKRRQIEAKRKFERRYVKRSTNSKQLIDKSFNDGGIDQRSVIQPQLKPQNNEVIDKYYGYHKPDNRRATLNDRSRFEGHSNFEDNGYDESFRLSEGVYGDGLDYQSNYQNDQYEISNADTSKEVSQNTVRDSVERQFNFVSERHDCELKLPGYSPYKEASRNCYKHNHHYHCE